MSLFYDDLDLKDPELVKVQSLDTGGDELKNIAKTTDSINILKYCVYRGGYEIKKAAANNTNISKLGYPKSFISYLKNKADVRLHKAPF